MEYKIESKIVMRVALTLITIAIAATTLFGQKNKNIELPVSIKESTVEWTGKKLTGEHYGNINLTEGVLSFSGNVLNGGSFVFDMNSISCTDITDEKSNKRLVDHLKSDDFFSVRTYPTSKFVITSVQKKEGDTYDITGDLTIKNITNRITFPATVVQKNGRATASATLVFDRSKYDVKFGSQSFFDNLGDKLVYDDVELKVTLLANAQSTQ